MDREEALSLCFHLMDLGFTSYIEQPSKDGYSVCIVYEDKGYRLKKNENFYGKVCTERK